MNIYAIFCAGTDSPEKVGIHCGNERIFIECAKRWSSPTTNIHVIISYDGLQKCKMYGLDNIKYTVSQPKTFRELGTIKFHIINTITSSIKALTIPIDGEKTIVYPSCEFFMDLIPAWIIKTRNKKVKFIASFYLFSPNPFTEQVYQGFVGKIRNIFWFFSQKFGYWLIRKNADMVFVTNEQDRWKFINTRLIQSKVIAVRGGVDINLSKSVIAPQKKKYDVVSIGRFHPQKGILEFIEIWRKVVDVKNDAKLVIIGAGDLEKDIHQKIQKYDLENNIIFTGFKDGVEKLKIFKNSKIVVEPSIYASGGMASVEAMSCGLPGICFDLPVWREYFPKGMIKIPLYNLEDFANQIIFLLNNNKKYLELQKEALELADEWDWDKRSQFLLESIENLFLESDNND